MSGRRLLALACLAAGGVASFAAVLLPTGCTHTAAPPSIETAPIVIGVSLGLTNDFASLAGPMKNGVKVAEAQVNAVGGLLGRPVEFRVVDDMSNSSASSSGDSVLRGVVDGFLDAGAVSLLGPIGSQQVADIEATVAAQKLLEISASATAIDLADAQPPRARYFFRTVPSDDLQGKAIALFATTGTEGSITTTDDAGNTTTSAVDAGASAHAACHTMAIVNASDAYGTGLYTSVVANLERLGATVAVHIEVPTAVASSYTSQVAQVLAASPDCLGIFSYDDVGARFIANLATARAMSPNALAPRFFIVGSDGLFDDGFLTDSQLDPGVASRGSSAAGVYGTSPDSAPPTPEYNAFRELYNASFPLADGAITGQYVANIYDAAILSVLAIEKAGGVASSSKVRDALFDVSSGGTSFGPAQLDDALHAIRQGVDIDYDGASGSCDFDDNGNVVTNYIVWQVQNGAFSNPPVTRIQASDLK